MENVTSARADASVSLVAVLAIIDDVRNQWGCGCGDGSACATNCGQLRDQRDATCESILEGVEALKAGAPMIDEARLRHPLFLRGAEVSVLRRLRSWLRYQRLIQWDLKPRRAVNLRLVALYFLCTTGIWLAAFGLGVPAAFAWAAAFLAALDLHRVHVGQRLVQDAWWLGHLDLERSTLNREIERLRAALEEARRCPVCRAPSWTSFRPVDCPGCGAAPGPDGGEQVVG